MARGFSRPAFDHRDVAFVLLAICWILATARVAIAWSQSETGLDTFIAACVMLTIPTFTMIRVAFGRSLPARPEPPLAQVIELRGSQSRWKARTGKITKMGS